MTEPFNSKRVIAEDLSDDYLEVWMTNDGEQGAQVFTGYDSYIGKVFYVKWDDSIRIYKERFAFLHETSEFLENMGFELYDVTRTPPPRLKPGVLRA